MADVKFSELASLAAADVASADILAIVDTDAATSKKLTIDALFGSVPVNVLQTDNTEATSSAGAVRTAGGISMARKLFVGTTSTLTGAVTATAGVFPAAQDGAPLGSTSLQFSDLFLADSGVVGFGDDNDTTLTHTDGSGLTLNSTNKIMFGDAATFIHQSTDGQLDIAADVELEITAPIVDIDASTAVTISNDVKLDSDSCVLGFGLNNDVTLTHYADNGLVLNSTRKIYFDDGVNFDQYIASAGSGETTIASPAEISLVSPIVDIDASTGIALDGANLSSAWTVNTTNKIQFHNASQYINAPAVSRLAIVSDGPIEATSTMLKVGLASQDANIQALTDAFDMTLKQFDGQEVARIFDGSKALTDTDAATVKSGFGHRRPVISIDASSSSKAVTLTDKESGSLIKVNNGSGSYAAAVTLPALGANGEGVFFEFVMTVNNGSVFTIQAAEGASVIHAYSMTVATAGSDIAGGDVMTIAANATKGTFIRCTAVVGSGTASAVLWLAEVYQPAGTAVAVA